MDIGKVEKREIVEEMKESYLDYAMSVIVARALPDVRDGLKPVHRRVLYAMHQLGLRPQAKYRKSAMVVGEVLGKYHPHGDIPVYDSLVRMAQDFSLRYPMVDGQGNFGSIDGDAAAHMRYTECRLARPAEEMLADIEKDTVDFIPNYDDSRKEPQVLPARIPQLLINGTVGIAVGMATSIPPHNLREVIDATFHLIDNPGASSEDLFRFVPGPDFPTGGIIYDARSIAQSYGSGRGPILTRAKTEITEAKEGQFQIIVTEIPFQVNKAVLVEKIADLVKEKKIDGIKDLRDESNKDGIRVVVELKSGAYPQKVLNQLFKLTDLQKAFHMNMIALTDGLQPQVLSLKGILEKFLEYRRVVVERRTRFDLNRSKERAHILEGLKKALDHIDRVIIAIRKSATKEEAHKNLVKNFKLSDAQAQAILEMRLQTLAGLERQKIDDEFKEKHALIKELEAILKSPSRISLIIKNELKEIKDKYGDERRTQVVKGKLGEFSEEDLIPNEEMVIVMTRGGYIKRMSPKLYRTQHRGGKGIIGLAVKDEDAVEYFLIASMHDRLLFFTDRGRVFSVKAYELPEASRTAKGQAIVNFLQIAPEEKITEIVPLQKTGDAKYLLMVTRKGIVKKTKIEDFAEVRRSGLIAVNLKKNDLLEWARATSGSDDVIIVTNRGQAIRFHERGIRPMGRTAAGVIGIRLKKDDEVVGTDIITEELGKGRIMVLMENGYGKRASLAQYKKQGRGGSGVKTAKITSKTGSIVSAMIVQPDAEDIIVISKQGQVIRTKIETISVLGRATQGVRIMKLSAGDQVASVTMI